MATQNPKPGSRLKPSDVDQGFGQCVCGRYIQVSFTVNPNRPGTYLKKFTCGRPGHPSHLDTWAYDHNGAIIE